MLSVTYGKFGLKLTHIYFATEEEIKSNSILKSAGDIVFLHGSLVQPVSGVLYTKQNTLIKDLSLSESEIFSSFGKHLQQYIKRSQKEGLIQIKIFDSEEIKNNPQILSDCKRLYEKMFSDKGMKVTFNTKLSEKYVKHNSFCVAMAYDKIPIGFSAIIHNDSNARLYVAAFDFRNDLMDSQVLSRGHQRLDWELLRWCKKKGITAFDFGGVNSFEEPNGIAQFKMKFESDNRVTYSNYLIPNSLMGKLVIKIMKRRG